MKNFWRDLLKIKFYTYFFLTYNIFIPNGREQALILRQFKITLPAANEISIQKKLDVFFMDYNMPEIRVIT